MHAELVAAHVALAICAAIGLLVLFAALLWTWERVLAFWLRTRKLTDAFLAFVAENNHRWRKPR